MKINIDIRLVEHGNLQLIETIKLLLYKLDEDIFDQLDFDQDEIYANPLLFAFFNSGVKKKESLGPLIFSFTQGNEISVYSDHSGRIYLPNIGWLLTAEKECEYTLSRSENGIVLKKGGVCYPYVFEPIEYIPNTRIELLKYPVALLAPCYYDVDGNLIDVEIEQITDKQRAYLQKGFELIQKYIPEHFKLIEQVTRQVVIFNVDTFLRNSFATTLAHGVAFFNACQEGYNEVFFVDDIAHQTGHIIFTALIDDFEQYVIVEKEHIVESIPLADRPDETRNIHVVFHALFTYYTTFMCLDACLEANEFLGHKKQEALARIGFYLRKCYHDLELFENPLNGSNKIKHLFTAQGAAIYNLIKEKYLNTVRKYGSSIRNFNLDDQPYNFNYAIFLASNPFNEAI
ncbi:hypothetical protein [Sphingobacterium multivorum]|uniref:hypothetical protein n=1 Tax=Sphingobacterium multivorum TaxID=28454 RepID=UPI002899867D|nr:hypothetical protein [Sphingobacterium multivorum]